MARVCSKPTEDQKCGLLIQEILAVAPSMGRMELECLLLVALKLRNGNADHGRLYPDKKDFTVEGLEEYLDGPVYLAAHLVSLMYKREPGKMKKLYKKLYRANATKEKGADKAREPAILKSGRVRNTGASNSGKGRRS